MERSKLPLFSLEPTGATNAIAENSLAPMQTAPSSRGSVSGFRSVPLPKAMLTFYRHSPPDKSQQGEQIPSNLFGCALIICMPSKSRAPKPSATKKTTSETGRAKHRSASGPETLTISPAVESAVIDPVGVMTPSPEAQEATHAHISKLAYSYWIARDHAHGFADEDWHRAEREVKETH